MFWYLNENKIGNYNVTEWFSSLLLTFYFFFNNTRREVVSIRYYVIIMPDTNTMVIKAKQNYFRSALFTFDIDVYEIGTNNVQ